MTENPFHGHAKICEDCVNKRDTNYPYRGTPCRKVTWTEHGIFAPRLVGEETALRCDYYKVNLPVFVKNWLREKYAQLIQYGVPLTRI